MTTLSRNSITLEKIILVFYSKFFYSILEVEQCDWPHLSPCKFDPNAVKAKLVKQKSYLYLTFDDGPNEGTDFVLEALAEINPPATFFINR